MENVVAFNNELSGLYDSKPPISKAKMAAITKSAMRAIKFYKHVVQSVEKFILKCKPEYKVPGLYVIDSIVRQSRHQYGPEKDVFAPRFARNIKETFANLFRCAPEDKSRIIRVLNLWQKNNVFAPEVIQPIFDLADPNHPIYQMPPAGLASGSGGGAGSGSGGLADISSTSNGLNTSGSSGLEMSGMVGNAPIGGSSDDKIGGLPDLSLLSQEKAQNVLDNSTLRQLEHMQQYLKRQTSVTTSSTSTSLSHNNNNKSRDTHLHISSYGCLIDNNASASIVGSGSGGVGGVGNISSTSKTHHSETYTKYPKISSSSHDMLNYNTEDDDVGCVDDNSPQHSSNLIDNNNLKQLLNDPNVLRQLQTLQNFQKFKQTQEEKQYKMSDMRLQEEAFEKHLQIVLKASAGSGSAQDATDFTKEVEFVSEEQKIEVINLDGNDDSRSPSPERDRYKRRRSSRSRSRSRDRGGGGTGGGGGGGGGGGRDRDRRRRSRSPRSRSRSPRSSRRRSSRERDRSTRDREHERERRKKGLPELKKEHLSVCSTTLWVGHLSKLVYQEELSDTFGEYGDIVSIDQIVPRGCAFIVMNRRQDSYKAMQALKNHKLQGRAITISWAAGKGVKSKEWKDFWDLELGVTYIPWNKLDEDTDLDSLEEGGMFDEDSMPGWMKDKINHLKSLKEKINEPAPMGAPGNMLFGIDTTQPPPGPPPSGGPPMMPMVPGQFSMAPPMGGPPRMLGPMGMPLPGIPMPTMGMPPPHAMMMTPGMMPPPNFAPIPGQVGGPPPMGPPHMGLGPGPAQFPPPVGSATAVPPPSSGMGHVSSDDQMDIEMDEDDGPIGVVTPTTTQPGGGAPPNQLNFNQPPPPMFTTGPPSVAAGNANDNEVFSRDRNRGPGASTSRWGGRGNVEDDAPLEAGPPPRWRENGGPGGPPNFNESRGGGRPMNIPPLDLNKPPQRPDFMSDFDNRGGGPRGGIGPPRGGGNHNGDFYPNMQNRFSQPTSLLQMRIPPPNSFNPRMAGGPGGPPMFMRGPGGPGGRQQGPGFFNPRNPFDRDMGRGGRGGPGGGRGGGRGGRGGGGGGPGGPVGMGNWSDEESDDNNVFKRRPGPPGGGNRFRDRDVADDWHNRERGGRRGGPQGQRDRYERGEHRDNDWERERGGGRNAPGGGNRRISRDESKNDTNALRSVIPDTEDDWDRELEEYDAKMSLKTGAFEANENTTSNKNANNIEKKWEAASSAAKDVNKAKMANEQKENFAKPESNETKSDEKKKDSTYSDSTPLYDELPAPVATMSHAVAVSTTTAPKTSSSAPSTSTTSAATTSTPAADTKPGATPANVVKKAEIKPADTETKPENDAAKIAITTTATPTEAEKTE